MFNKLFNRKPELTTMEEFGTPWTVVAGAWKNRHHPADTLEALTSLMRFLAPSLDRPVTLVYDRGSAIDALCVTSYEQALPFITDRTTD